jgi:hypothetical protein
MENIDKGSSQVGTQQVCAQSTQATHAAPLWWQHSLQVVITEVPAPGTCVLGGQKQAQGLQVDVMAPTRDWTGACVGWLPRSFWSALVSVNEGAANNVQFNILVITAVETRWGQTLIHVSCKVDGIS